MSASQLQTVMCVCVRESKRGKEGPCTFLMTCSLKPDLSVLLPGLPAGSGLLTISLSCSRGSWSRAPYEAEPRILATRIKPSQSGREVQTFLAMSLERRLVATKEVRDLYVWTDLMTW